MEQALAQVETGSQGHEAGEGRALPDWKEAEVHPLPQGTSLRDFVHGHLKSDAIQVSSLRPCSWKHARCMCVFVYCRSCAAPCGFRRRFVLVSKTVYGPCQADSEQVVVQEHSGEHSGGESQQLVRKRKREVKERLSKEEGAPSRLRLRELNSGDVPAHLLPTARQIGRYRSEKNFEDRLKQASTQTELREFMIKFAPGPDKLAAALWSDPSMITITPERIMLPFTCDYCLRSLGRLAAKGEEVSQGEQS